MNNTYLTDTWNISSHCPKCGKPYIYVGDPIGNIEDYVCTCYIDKKTIYHDTYGWICPRCKKVYAPWVKECDCIEQPQSSCTYYYTSYIYHLI